MADHIETRVALIEERYNQTNSLLQKLDTAIEKITGLSNEVTKMLAIHEEKLALREAAEEDLYRLLEERRLEIQTSVKELNADHTAALEKTSKEIMGAIKELESTINENKKSSANKIQTLEARIATLEKWRWVVVGGAIVLGFLFSQVSPFLYNMVNR